MRKLFNNNDFKEFRQQLRNDLPPAEARLWQYLRGSQLGSKFRRQYGIDIYVVDFYCPSAKLAIELDGSSHFEPGESIKDKKRQDYIESLGIRVIRFTNKEVYESLDDVVGLIQAHLPPTPSNSPSERGRAIETK